VTKDDCVALVDRMFATWGQDPSKAHRAATAKAWWVLVHDLDAGDCHRALTELAVTATFAPRAAEVRRAVLLVDAPPAPAEAWATFQAMLRAVNAGAAPPECHPLVRACIGRLGGGSGMHTNGDREVFTGVYRTLVADWERDQLLPPVAS
jgi:hypothetical protein